MQTYGCMLCKKSDKDFINICYKNGHNSAKDDILELCGLEIEEHLESEDHVCTMCMKVLENIIKLKRQIYEIILEHSSNREATDRISKKTLNLTKVWDLRLTPTYSYEDLTEPQSPNDLLIATSSIAYDQRSDTDIEEASKKYRSDIGSTPDLDREVHSVNYKRRKRGHRWTQRKGGRSSRSNSRLTPYSVSTRSTVVSRASRTTTASRRQQLQKQAEQLQIKRILGDLLTQNDSLSEFAWAYLAQYIDNYDELNIAESLDYNNHNGQAVKTRFAKELRDKLINEYQKLIYECPYHLCGETSMSLEIITEHIVSQHNETARFLCDQCNYNYLTQEHLERHQQKHYQNFLSYCIYCFEEFRNKKLYEQHLDEHLIHSFPCIYCDKYFLTKQLCDNHIREQHPGKKRKIKRLKPQSILDRIDKYPDYNSKLNETNSSRSNLSNQKLVIRVLLQNKSTEVVTTDENVGNDTVTVTAQEEEEESQINNNTNLLNETSNNEIIEDNFDNLESSQSHIISNENSTNLL